MKATERQALHAKLDWLIEHEEDICPTHTDVLRNVEQHYMSARQDYNFTKTARKIETDAAIPPPLPEHNRDLLLNIETFLPMLRTGKAQMGRIVFLARNRAKLSEQLVYRIQPGKPPLLFIRATTDPSHSGAPETWEQPLQVVKYGNGFRFLCEIPEPAHPTTELVFNMSISSLFCRNCDQYENASARYAQLAAQHRKYKATLLPMRAQKGGAA